MTHRTAPLGASRPIDVGRRERDRATLAVMRVGSLAEAAPRLTDAQVLDQVDARLTVREDGLYRATGAVPDWMTVRQAALYARRGHAPR